MDMLAEGLVDLVALNPLAASDQDCIGKVLRAIRTHLGMDVAFISQFRSTDRVFRHVDAAGNAPLRPGDSLSLEQGYCQRVVDGRLPQVIPDTAELPEAMALPDTQALPIGSHISVPIHLSDGRLYGTFCCFSYAAEPSLSQRDVQIMKVFAELIADRIEGDLPRLRNHERKIQRLRTAMAAGQPQIVYQPIFDLQDMSISGWECLSRFNIEPQRGPDLWFREAAEVGLGPELECHAIRCALTALERLPKHTYLSINCSPELLLSGRLNRLLKRYPASRLVLELTEHAVVGDYQVLQLALEPLRAQGVRVAIDDAGAGYASMRHILQLRPDMIKLDMSLTQGVDHDDQRRALASALIAFARETDTIIVAEGVETQYELETLIRLGASRAQGFLLGAPKPLELFSDSF